MNIETTTRNGVAIATLDAASIETGNVSAFRKAITPVAETHLQVVLDLSKVEFMDSTGLGAMLSCLRALKAKNGVLKLASLTTEVAQLFELVMMDRVFEVYSDVDHALASFA